MPFEHESPTYDLILKIINLSTLVKSIKKRSNLSLQKYNISKIVAR